MDIRAWKILIAVVFVLALVPANASDVQYRLYEILGPWSPDVHTLPNHVCIFPDGQTKLSDAKYGDLEIMIGFLQYTGNDGLWHGLIYDGEGIMLDWGLGNVALCGKERPLLACNTSRPHFYANVNIAGGGHSAIDASGDPIASAVVWWAPDPSVGAVPIELYINSPDIDGDLDVDGDDQAIFVLDLSGPYNFRSDLNYDGIVNLSDVSIFTQSVGTSCP